ncbi:aminotransferase class I/II-fold pyridoxal phosphate-dependent enzyme [Marinomonas spartinae]|uniref:aminotransferase class I/II-fold pyridoxal phosphate-dependent enzyme n=1 Tax=Marinomonas spartinae TaxID=1792290 RepID=UPI0018F1D8D9|nr:aminotransferase class I/II-fold pyridoxal phosphate-dependent enzyme [Marinomonas spartinae]MBJ7553536.1 aminotransferase class I/II-fold pyridoxal phosphate-dependent enzyme [Marinomonas spartinae]
MESVEKPWTNLFSSFEIYKDSIAQNNLIQIPQISSGVNWLPLSNSIIEMIHAEINLGLLYRNYTAPYGILPTCQVIKLYECCLANTHYNTTSIKVAQCNGSAQGIATYMKVATSYYKKNRILIVGSSYPIFYNQADIYQCEMIQCQSDDSSVPSAERVIHIINKEKPTIIILSLPNNPSGTCYSSADLDAILTVADHIGAHVLIDRVGMLVSNQHYMKDISSVVKHYIENGRVAVIDSLSKSESLAGYRLGHIFGSTALINDFITEQQNMIMNPPTVLGLTIPLIFLSRIIMLQETPEKKLSYKKSASLFFKKSLKMIDDDSRDIILEKINSDFISQFSDQYIINHQQNEATMLANKHYALAILKDEISFVSEHHAGMNFFIKIEKFKFMNERDVQRILAYTYNVFILTERCFSISTSERSNFLIRLSIAMSTAEFSKGVDRLYQFIKTL